MAAPNLQSIEVRLLNAANRAIGLGYPISLQGVEGVIQSAGLWAKDPATPVIGLVGAFLLGQPATTLPPSRQFGPSRLADMALEMDCGNLLGVSFGSGSTGVTGSMFDTFMAGLREGFRVGGWKAKWRGDGFSGFGVGEALRKTLQGLATLQSSGRVPAPESAQWIKEFE